MSSSALLLIGSARVTWAQEVKVYDLGHYPGGTWAEPRDISNSGVVVGFGDIASGSTRPIGVPVHGPNAGEWFDLGTLGGERTGYPYVMCMAVADSGLIVGHAATATAQRYVHAFAWTDHSGMLDIGTLDGHNWSLAYGTNKAGTLIVGWSGPAWPSKDHLPVAWTPQLVWRSGRPTMTWAIHQLDTTGLEHFGYWYAGFVNNYGQIIGTAYDAATDLQIAVLWNPVPGGKGWKIEQLPASSDYPNAWANDINDRGEIVGGVAPSDWSANLPALWKPAGRPGNTRNLTVLPALPGFSGYDNAIAINNRGDIVGYGCDDYYCGFPSAALWSAKELDSVRVLGLPGTWSVALAVNDNGIAAGAYGSDTVQENVVAVRLR
jgi:probable HAF family extracellular repeat protein